MSHIWPLPHGKQGGVRLTLSGLLLERALFGSHESLDDTIEKFVDEDESLPTLFSLLDPLDEVKPFSYQYLPDPNRVYHFWTQAWHLAVDPFLIENFFVCAPQTSIAWSSYALPFIVTYNGDTKKHTAYLLRKAETENEDLTYQKATQSKSSFASEINF